MKIHTTKDGLKIKLCDMTDSHLEATIRLLERKAKEGIVIRSGSGSCPCDFCYDEDDFWCDEYRLQGEAALQLMGYKDYIEERDLRITNNTFTSGGGRWKGRHALD